MNLTYNYTMIKVKEIVEKNEQAFLTCVNKNFWIDLSELLLNKELSFHQELQDLGDVVWVYISWPDNKVYWVTGGIKDTGKDVDIETLRCTLLRE